MKSLKQVYIIGASKEKVWDALVNPITISNWGTGPASMETKAGSKFSLWGGEIHGKNLEVIPEKTLKQEWTSGDWKTPSLVIFKLVEKGKQTQLTLEQTNIPTGELDDIAKGWKQYYFDPIKKLLEIQ